MSLFVRLLVRLLNGVAAVAGVIVVGLVAAALLIDPNDYKARIVDAVQDATGRTLTLGGELTLTRSLWPTLEARDVSLSNLAGGSRPQMVHVERIEGQLALLSLLRHEVEITRLSLTGPDILFETVAGAPNWVFAPAAPSVEATGSGDGTPTAPFTLQVVRAHVVNGMVTWRLPARTKVMGIRALDFVHETEGVKAQAVLVYSDNAPFALDIAAQPTGGLMDPWQTALKFSAFDATATATGRMAVDGHYDMQVDGRAGAVEKLNALLPEMGLPALHQATLSAHLVNGPRPGDLPAIGPASLQFASADLRQQLSGLVLAATRVTLPAAGGQAAVESTGTYGSTGFHVTGALGVPTHLDGKASVPVAGSVTAAGGTMTLKGTMAVDTLQFGGMEAAVTLRAAALESMRPVLGESVPALNDVDLSAQATVPAKSGPVRLRGVALRSAQGDVAGEGSVALAAPLSLSGTWTSQALDLDAMLAAFGIDLSAAGPGSKTGPMIPDTALPWAALRGPTLDLGLTIGSMRFSGQVWRDVQAAIALKGGRLQAGPVSVAMPRSRMQASLTVDANVAAAPVQFTVAAPALPLALIAQSFDVPGPMAGTADVSVQLRGRGATVRAVAGSLEGPFSITAVNGQLTNKALIELTGAALTALGITVPAAGATSLDCLGLVGSFASGVGTLRTIALQTNYLSLQGAGQVDLGRETVALTVQPMAVVAGSKVSVPVVVRGPFRDVSGTLDAGGLEKLGFFIDGLFGGDTSNVCRSAGLGR